MKAILLTMALAVGMTVCAQTTKVKWVVTPAEPVYNLVPCNVSGPFWGDDGCVSYQIHCSNMADYVTVTNCKDGIRITWSVLSRSMPTPVTSPVIFQVQDGAPIDMNTMTALRSYLNMQVSQDQTYEDDEKIITYKAGRYEVINSEMHIIVTPQ